jgi:hypothetical protein
MKMPIAWHRKRLANMTRHWERKAAVWGREIQRLQELLRSASEERELYRSRIDQAEAEGQDDLEADMSSILRAKQ